MESSCAPFIHLLLMVTSCKTIVQCQQPGYRHPYNLPKLIQISPVLLVLCVCVCVCVREREREISSMQFYHVSVHVYTTTVKT